MMTKMRAVIEALAKQNYFGVALYDIYNEENDMLFGVSGWKLREFARDCKPIDDLLRYKQDPGGSRSALYKNVKPT